MSRMPNCFSARPTLGQTLRFDSFAGVSGHPEVAGSVAVDAAAQAVLFDDFSQGRHHGARRFFFHQLSVVDLTGRVVQHGQQLIPAFILKPLVPTSVDVQHHSRKRPPGASLSVRLSSLGLGHQPRSLQGRFHPAVTEPDPVFRSQLLMKVPHVVIPVFLSVQLQHLLHGL